MGLGICEICGVNGGHDQNCSKTSVSAVASNDGLSDAEQAINALEKLAKHHDTINKFDDARSNREYIKVIKGQLICHKLVDEALGR